MAPSKANLVMERRKSDVPSEGDAEGPEVLGGLTTALTHLSLHPDTPPKDLAKLEDHLSQITLDDTQTQEEDFKRHKEEEEEEKEEAEPQKKRETEEEDLKRDEEEEEEKDRIKDKEAKKSETEEEEEDKIRKESEQSEAEEEEEEEKEKKATVNTTKEKGEVLEEKKPSEGKILQEGKEEEDSKEKDDKEEDDDDDDDDDEEEEEEEEESDDENPTDEEVNAQARKQKLRSRGLMHGVGHGYAPSSHLDYQGFQQQPQQQQILYQQPSLASHQIGLSSPQYGEAAGYAGASPTHSGARGEMQWYSGGGVQLETECGTSLFPSMAESSPASICSSADSDSPHLLWGYGPLDSPQSQYQDGNAPCYAQPCQGSPYTQYQASPSGHYQPSPPHYPDNGIPQYANYQDPLDAGFQDQGYQDHGYQTSPFLDGASLGTLVHSAPALPSLSPSVAETRTEGKGNQLDYICEALETVIKDKELGIPHDEKRIIEITKSLLDIKQVHSLREGLDEEKYREYYEACAILIDENFVEPDEDGDIKIMLAASQGQAQPGYEERLVAMTERVETINLCCNTVVDWHVNRCRHCGNTNKELFYSPLSWMNNYDQMVLSNVVSEMYPVLVVQYLTKKIMQRPMDLQRTFTKHYQLFFNNQEVYKCLTQPLRMVETMQMQHTEHGTTH